jgi:hypothetical protein
VRGFGFSGIHRDQIAQLVSFGFDATLNGLWCFASAFPALPLAKAKALKLCGLSRGEDALELDLERKVSR